MRADDEEIDWSGVSETSLAEIHRQAELTLEQILTVALAADSKVASLAQAYAATAAALGGGAAAIAALADGPDLGLLVGLVIGAAGFLVSSLLCAYAALPVDFWIAGNEPRYLAPAATPDPGWGDRAHGLAVAERWLLTSSADSLQRKIRRSRAIMSSSSRWSLAAYVTSIVSLVAAVIVGGAVHLLT